MNENLFVQNPNHYIKNLSQIRRQIQKGISSQLRSQQSGTNFQMQRQIRDNYDKYRKKILENQRNKISRYHKDFIERKRKQQLRQIIEYKIKMSQQQREKKKKQLIQNKKIQRLMKEVINKRNKQENIKKNVQQSLKIIQNIQLKYGNYANLPIKLRFLQEQFKSSKFQPKPAFDQGSKLYSQLIGSIKKQNLPTYNICNRKRSKNFTQKQQLFENQQLKDLQFEKLKQNQQLKKSRSEIILKSSKITLNNEEKILQKLIEQNQKSGYSQYLQKNSLSYKSLNHSRLRQVKNAIEGYLSTSGN